MLAQFTRLAHGGFNPPKKKITIMVSPNLPLAITEDRDGEVGLREALSNNGGYRFVLDDVESILKKLSLAGVIMTEFKTSYGRLFLNINKNIPLNLSNSKGGELRLNYPTHNNGGYIVTESFDQVVEHINSSLLHYE